jgi:hypothetical protein
MIQEEDGGTERAVSAAIRQAKKISRPSKIGAPVESSLNPKHGSHKTKKKQTGKQMGKGVGFERDMGDRSRP